MGKRLKQIGFKCGAGWAARRLVISLVMTRTYNMILHKVLLTSSSIKL